MMVDAAGTGTPRVGAAAGAAAATGGDTRVAGDAFRQVLARSLGSVRASRHAMQRLQQSHALDPGDMERLAGALDRAAARGARESLVVMDGMALVCNVPERTIITAVDHDRMDHRVFTNIDSAVIVGTGAGPQGGGPGSGTAEAARLRYTAMQTVEAGGTTAQGSPPSRSATEGGLPT